VSAFFERSVFIGLRIYKVIVSPLLGVRCRYLPTCSVYAAEVLTSHGPFKGSWLAAKRLCRCHPLGGSGYDPPPKRAAAVWKCDV
jgi:putative membrane protein insertion efficiency factor